MSNIFLLGIYETQHRRKKKSIDLPQQQQFHHFLAYIFTYISTTSYIYSMRPQLAYNTSQRMMQDSQTLRHAYANSEKGNTVARPRGYYSAISSKSPLFVEKIPLSIWNKKQGKKRLLNSYFLVNLNYALLKKIVSIILKFEKNLFIFLSKSQKNIFPLLLLLILMRYCSQLSSQKNNFFRYF